MLVSCLIAGFAALSLVAAPQEGEAAAPAPTQLRCAADPDPAPCDNPTGSAVLVAPVVDEGFLTAYAFIRPRLCLARGVSEFAVTSEMHFIFDGMVRAAHRTPLTFNEDQTLDREATRAAMLAAARAVTGEDRVDGLKLCGRDVRALN